MNTYDSNYQELSTEDIKGLFAQSASTLQATSEMLGVVTANVRKLNRKLLEVEEEQGSIREDFENYKIAQKEKEYIEPAEKENIAQAMKNRIADILREYHLDGIKYFGKFQSRFWRDAKKHSYLVGTGGVYTKKMHYRDVLNYVGTWIPERYGVMGYVEHLRVLEKCREEDNNNKQKMRRR